MVWLYRLVYQVNYLVPWKKSEIREEKVALNWNLHTQGAVQRLHTTVNRLWITAEISSGIQKKNTLKRRR